MRKNVFGRQLKRDIHERKALFKSLVSSLVLEERIVTTEAKAKSVKGLAEKLVTKARKGDFNSENALRKYLIEKAVKKMMQDIAPRFATRPGGYTRLIKLPNRFSDNAEMVAMEWVEKKAIKADAPVSSTPSDMTEVQEAVEVEKGKKKEAKKAPTKKAAVKKTDKKEAKPKAKKETK